MKLYEITFVAPIGLCQIFLINSECRPKLLKKFNTQEKEFKVKICLPSPKVSYLYVECNDYNTVFSFGGCQNTEWGGPKNPIVLNELTTVATTFCFARLFREHTCKCFNALLPFSRKEQLLNIALGFKNGFVQNNGHLSEVITSNPNALETNSMAMLNYLANILFYCQNGNTSVRTDFLTLTSSNTLIQAMLTVALNPFQNVNEIYDLIKDLPAIFTPALNTIILPAWKISPIPDQWTLTLKFNDCGSQNFLMSGLGYVAFDKDDKAWFPLNVRQGTPTSCQSCAILNSDGSPAKFSPLSGGGLLGAGFGVARNKAGDTIAIGNFGWGSTDYNPQNGSISIFKSDGQIISPPSGFVEGFRRAQGLFYDCHDNLWIAGWGDQNPLGSTSTTPSYNFPSSTSRVAVFLKGDPNRVVTYEFSNEYHHTFDVVVDDEGNAYVTNSGDASENIPSSIYHLKLLHDQLVAVNSWTSNSTEGFRQVNISPKGTVVVTAFISKRVLKFDKNLTPLGDFTTLMDGPWGVIFDKEGTMYTSNFRNDIVGVVDPATFDMAGKFGITIVQNEDDSTAKLATLPTGGDQIMLANGFPLYGSLNKPSYEPLMRLTGSNIDALGNIWAVNNWKPALMNDLGGNPGGDGVVVFISLAAKGGAHLA